MNALETALLALAGGVLLGLESLSPKAVNKAAARLRRLASKKAADGMGDVDDAARRDIVGKLVLSVVNECKTVDDAKKRKRAVKKAANDANKEAQKAAREVRRQTRKMASCMVDDLNARFLREAARARARVTGDSRRGIAAVNHRDAMREAVVRLAKDGLTAYTYKRKDGAVVHVPVDVGIRRAVDNAGKQRQIDQTISIAKATGANMVEVSTTVGARKSHAEWQGRRYMLKGSSAKYPNFYRACRKEDPVDGIGGYNCRHLIAVCREGDPPRFRDPLEGTGYSQEEARKALTQQRRMENDLRRMKRQREVMRQNGLSTKDLDSKIKALDKGLDAHVAKHSKILRRDKHRESIYERARKAAKAEGVVWLDKGQQRAVRKAEDEKDIIIGRSLSAAAFRDSVKLPDGTITKISEGTKKPGVKVIAGNGVKKKIKEIDRLVGKYGGKAADWQKKRGNGYVDDLRMKRPCELHWYEEKTAGRVDMKVKKFYY
nr:MAG TPA: minor capsid protein [Caudoviricetes sp.]